MKEIISLISGLIFGFGIIISGLLNPATVKNFLDIFGHWDPRLIFTLGVAVIISITSWQFRKKIRKSLLGEEFTHISSSEVDTKLISGSALFGIGWGLVGICPGPGFVGISYYSDVFVIFMVAMFVGFGLYSILNSVINVRNINES